jgi:hypothetical protein
MSAMRTFSPATQIVSPSTTQFVPPPVWHSPKVARTSDPGVAGTVLPNRLDRETSQAVTPAMSAAAMP